MFKRVKEKFNITGYEFSLLQKCCSGWEGLFRDYEALLDKSEEYKSDNEMFRDYITLLNELEAEILTVLDEIKQVAGKN